MGIKSRIRGLHPEESRHPVPGGPPEGVGDRGVEDGRGWRTSARFGAGHPRGGNRRLDSGRRGLVVTDGHRDDGFLLGSDRHLEAGPVGEWESIRTPHGDRHGSVERDRGDAEGESGALRSLSAKARSETWASGASTRMPAAIRSVPDQVARETSASSSITEIATSPDSAVELVTRMCTVTEPAGEPSLLPRRSPRSRGRSRGHRHRATVQGPRPRPALPWSRSVPRRSIRA